MGSTSCVPVPRVRSPACVPAPSGFPLKSGGGEQGWGGQYSAQAVLPAQVVRYQAGYLVCAVIAGLYLLVLPTAGLCFCCCRRRRRCGGRVKTEHKAMACERGTLMAFLLLTTLVLL